MTVIISDSLYRKFTIKISDILKDKSVIETYRTFLIKITAMGITIIISVLLARLLGVEGYGIYAYVLSWVNLLSIFAVFGIDRLLIRETAVHTNIANWGYVRGVLNWGNWLSLCIATTLALSAAGIAWLLENESNRVVVQSLWIALILLPFMAVTALRRATLQGLHKVALGQIPDDIVRPVVYALLLIITFLFFKESVIPQYVVAFNVFAYVSAFIAGIYILLINLPEEVKSAIPQYDSKTWLKAAMVLSFLGAIHIINREIRTLMLGHIGTIEDVGIYTVALRGADLIVLPINVINAIIASKFAGLYAAKDMAGLQSLLTRSTQVILAITIPCAAVLIGFSDLILGIFGESFLAGQKTLTILCIGSVLSCAMGSAGLLLTMTGYEALAARAIMYSLIANILLNLLLIPQWGAEGAAWSSAICLVALTACYAWWVYRELKLFPLPFVRKIRPGHH